MLLTNEEVEEISLKELKCIPSPEELLKDFIHGTAKMLLKEELEANIRKDISFPLIFRTKDIDTVISDIEDYVLENLADYIDMHKVFVQKVDYTKIVYWVGMYIFEVLNSAYGIEFLQRNIQEEIFEDTKCNLDDMMIVKMNDISKYKTIDKIANQTKFFRYYGRFGLYHSLKQSHRTLSSLNRKYKNFPTSS